MEDFEVGDPVALTEAPVDTFGRIVALGEDGRTAQVQWFHRPGYEHQVTTEDVRVLRRVHESEEGVA